MKYINYGRVSSQEQKKNTSVTTQLVGTQADMAELYPGSECVKSFTDVASARSDNRPGLQAAYSYVKWYNQVANAPITHVVVLMWDRFFRNRDLSGEWRNKFKAIGVEVNATREWVNYTDSGEVIVHSVREALAQAESMKNSERTRRGMKARMRAGYWIFDVHKGYKRSAVLDANGNRSIVIDPEPARQKVRALSFIAGGFSRKKAWRECGGREVLGSYNAFCDSLLSPFDIGRIDYTFPDGERVNVIGHHPPIVTKELQDAARRAIKKTPVTTSRETVRLARNPARQVLICPKCGKPLTSSTPRSRGRLHEYYSCYRSTKRGACGGYNLRRKLAHSKLHDLLSTVSLGPEALKKLERKASQHIGKKALQADLTRAVKDYDTAQRRLKAAFEMRLDGEIDREDLERAKKTAATAEERVTEARINLQGYDDLRVKLSTAFANIGPQIAKGLSDEAPEALSLKTHAFLQMLFPSGICLVPETSTFRIEEMNKVLCSTGLLSVSYEQIETPSLGSEGVSNKTKPELGGKPVVIRTLADHRALVIDYLRRFA